MAQQEQAEAVRSGRIVADRLAFAEGPRWHEDALWWSDMHAGIVQRMGPGGALETVCTVEHRPSGLGWLPDGRLLVASMADKRLLRREADGTLAVHADLSAHVPCRINDMVVDRHGRAYVGNFGFELDRGAPPAPTVLVRVDPDGRCHVAADNLMFPNGMVITPEGGTLVVAETFGSRLTAFDIGPDGGLGGRRIWASLAGGAVPDGICLDAAGAIWVASPTTHECIRVLEGGEVAGRIATGRGAYACMLGGADRRDLFVCTADSHDPARQASERNGRIEAFRAEVPGDGLP